MKVLFSEIKNHTVVHHVHVKVSKPATAFHHSSHHVLYLNSCNINKMTEIMALDITSIPLSWFLGCST